MTLLDKITGWLDYELRDYAEGVYLFNLSSKNRNLKHCFSKPENTYRMEKLIYELEKIRKSQPDQVKRFSAPPLAYITTPKKDPPKTKENVDRPVQSTNSNQNTTLTSIIHLRNKSFQKRNALRNRLIYIETDEKRLEAVMQIFHYQSIIKDCWYKIDHHSEHGTLPHGTLLGEDLINALKKKKDNLRTYISKYRKKIKGASDEKLIEKWTKKLNEYESEREQINLKLAL